MEDFILREIDRLGEMLLIIARKLGLQEDVMPDYSLFTHQLTCYEKSQQIDIRSTER